MKSVYILLSRSGTVYSHIVHLVTGGGYTHASLALGRGAERIYSFSRKYAHMPLPSPLVREDVLAFRKGVERTGALEFLARRIASDARFRSCDET